MRMQGKKGKGAKPEMMIPPDCEVLRFFSHREWGQLPVVRRQRIIKHKRVPILDQDTGKQLYRQPKDGAPKTYLFRNDPVYEEVICLLVPNRAGEILYQEHFEPDAQTLAAESRRAAVETMQNTLAERLVDAGVSPDDLVERLFGKTVEATLTTDVVDSVEPEEFELTMTSPGMFTMPDGAKFKGTKVKARAHLETNYPDYGGAA